MAETSDEALLLTAIEGCGCAVDLVWCSACVNATMRKLRGDKQQYRVVWQREGGVQLVKQYATLARAQDRYERLRADFTAKPLLYCRIEARSVGEWERKTNMKDGKWYLGAMNDGLFIIDEPPQPAPIDYFCDADHSVNVIVAMGNDRARAEAIIEAHNTIVDRCAKFNSGARSRDHA